MTPAINYLCNLVQFLSFGNTPEKNTSSPSPKRVVVQPKMAHFPEKVLKNITSFLPLREIGGLFTSHKKLFALEKVIPAESLMEFLSQYNWNLKEVPQGWSSFIKAHGPNATSLNCS